MKGLVVRQFGCPPQMVVEERPAPSAKEGFTLVRMKAATINQLSSTVRSGGIEIAKAPLVLGNEGAGIVESSTKFKSGTHVAIYGGGQLGIAEDGLQQEWVLVEDKRIFPLPAALTLNEGAAITVNYITAYQALNRIAGLKKGQNVLISGATGSLGHALMQMTHALGAHPIALVSTATKARRAIEAGAHKVIDLSSENLRDAVFKTTDGEGADLALDSAGGPVLGQLLRSVRPHGTVVAIGFAGGTEASLDLVDLIVHEKRLLGYDLHLEADIDVARVLVEISDLITKGLLRPIIDSTYPIEAFESGYQRLASREAVGSVVLSL